MRIYLVSNWTEWEKPEQYCGIVKRTRRSELINNEEYKSRKTENCSKLITIETYKSLQGKSLQNFKSLRFFETFFVTIYTSRLYICTVLCRVRYF